MKLPKSIEEAKKAFASGEYSPSQLVEVYLQKIEELNPTLNAYLEVFSDVAELAKTADERYKNGTARELEGIPFAVKDCILLEGKHASAGSKMLEKYIASYDATAIKQLREVGALFLGRTNMDEFAMGGTGENSAYGSTLNPHDHSRVPGGTSSGSAVAVSADMCLVALGSDTGGSVRQPGSFCGVYGYKPSYGGVSRFGLIAAGSSLDQIGVLANTVEDVQMVQKVVYKQDLLDDTTIPDTLRATYDGDVPFKKTILYPKNLVDSDGINKGVQQNFYEFLDKAKKVGYDLKEVDIDSLKYALAMYYIIMPAEVSTNLSRMDGLRFGGGDVGEVSSYQDLFKKTRGKFFGAEAKRRIIIGTYVLSHGYYDAYYGKATLLREQLKAEFAKVFAEGSIYLTPTAPTTAFKLKGSGEDRDPLTLYLEDIFTVPANLAQLPGISIPSGKDLIGLPYGVQALAPFGHDHFLFQFAKDLE
jgi:aspartyl-tRNA(Asn)/glutamyl-tRNA(Gln) amidotransferase subunit A